VRWLNEHGVVFWINPKMGTDDMSAFVCRHPDIAQNLAQQVLAKISKKAANGLHRKAIEYFPLMRE